MLWLEALFRPLEARASCHSPVKGVWRCGPQLPKPQPPCLYRRASEPGRMALGDASPPAPLLRHPPGLTESQGLSSDPHHLPELSRRTREQQITREPEQGERDKLQRLTLVVVPWSELWLLSGRSGASRPPSGALLVWGEQEGRAGSGLWNNCPPPPPRHIGSLGTNNTATALGLHLAEPPVIWKMGHSPLLGLHVHYQGDIALNEGEGEEADVATVLPGSHGVLHSGGQGMGW